VRPVWLIETGVWQDGNVGRMIALLRDLGVSVHAEPYAPHLGGTDFLAVEADRPVVFYGSLNTAERLRVLGPDWVPFVWFDRAAFSCRSYYAHWGDLLIQEQYAFYPLAELPRLKRQLYRLHGRDGAVFVRPDDNDKSFSGRLVPEETFATWYEEATALGADPAALAVVASPVRIDAEWRLVVADRRVIAASAYKGGDRLPRPPERHLAEAVDFAARIAAAPWQPRPIYCLDVAFCGGRFGVLEIGGINSAGLYRCDLSAVVRAMNEIAVREFRAWTGKG
jgi:hypothetical protein